MTTHIINGFYADDLQITIDEQGEGGPTLLLHGGGGPPSMGPLPSALAEDFEVIAPVHPGFAGTRLQTIPQAGHLPHLEQPEQVLQAIHRFAHETTHSATT